MRPDPADGAARPADVMEFGGPGGDPRRTRTVLVVLAVVAAAVAVIGYVRHEAAGPAPPAAAKSSPTAPTTGPASPSPSDAPTGPQVTEVGHPLLGVTATWQLVGYGPGVLVRIEPAAGRITRTSVPAVDSSGPVSLVAGTGWAVIRPLDNVAGIEVRDGRAAEPAPGALAHGGLAAPGPRPDSLWVAADTATGQRLILAAPDGHPLGPAIDLPNDLYGVSAQPDGTGYLLVSGPDGVYLARPDGLRRAATGILLATGPTRWLAISCDDRHRCAAVVTDRGSGQRHTLAGLAGYQPQGVGVISPDGRHAAVLASPSAGGEPALHLIDLDTGDDRTAGWAPDTVGQPGGDGALAFSPDGRWLFAAAPDGRLHALDPATGHDQPLDVDLPKLSQLAVR